MRVRPILVALCLTGLLAGPAAAGTKQPVGGELLGAEGLVVRAGQDVPKPPKVQASSYVVAELDSNAVLAAKDPHGRYRPASTIKALTAITLLPRLEPGDKVRPGRRAVAVEGSKVGVTTDMRYRVKDLFNGLLLSSGNDAAVALAQAAGGLGRTVALMNEKARELHAYDTVAKTPHGLDRAGQRSSAYDLALLAQAGLDMPAFREYVGTVRAEFPAPGGGSFRIANHNDLLTEYEGAIGVKTGYTTKAKATYIGAARRDGRTIVVTLMHAKPDFWKDAHALLDWGFAAAGKVRPVGTLVEPGPLPSDTATGGEGSASDTGGDGHAPTRGKATPALPPPQPGGHRVVAVLLVATLAGVTALGFAGLALRRRPAQRHQGRYQGRRRNPPN